MDMLPFDLPLSDPRHPFHIEHMQMALEEARTAFAEDEVPVGAVIVSLEQGVIARAHNQREALQDPTAHAEMIAITQAAQALRSWRLERCILYVTLEPCAMCAGAVVLAQLPMLVYGAVNAKAGACETFYHIANDPRLNHRAQVVRGVLADPCAAILTEFFAAKRKPPLSPPGERGARSTSVPFVRAAASVRGRLHAEIGSRGVRAGRRA